MIFNAERIRGLIEDKGILHKTLCSSIGISQQALTEIFKTNAIHLKNLEKIAVYFNVPVGYFFDDFEKYNRSSFEHFGLINNNGGNNSNVRNFVNINDDRERLSVINEKVKYLEAMLKEKELRLKEKDMVIELLKNKK